MNLIRFIKENENWEQLLQAEPYHLTIKRKAPYILFKYSQIKSDFSIELVREARGIIFNEETWECVCRGFNKFGNYGESYVDFDFSDMSKVKVLEKVDGTLIRVWKDKNGFHVSTNGNIDAADAKIGDITVDNFKDLFIESIPECAAKILNDLEGVTVLFELIGPKNRIVIPYLVPDCVILGAFNNKTGEFTEPSVVQKELKKEGLALRIPLHYTFHEFKTLKEFVDEMPWTEEGMVCVHEDGSRCKVKSPQYIQAHYARNNNIITQKRLIDIILKGEQEEFLCYAEEYKQEIDRILLDITGVCGDIDVIAKSALKLYDKKVAYAISNFKKRLPNFVNSYVFAAFKDKSLLEDGCRYYYDIEKWDFILKSLAELGAELLLIAEEMEDLASSPLVEIYIENSLIAGNSLESSNL